MCTTCHCLTNYDDILTWFTRVTTAEGGVICLCPIWILYRNLNMKPVLKMKCVLFIQKGQMLWISYSSFFMVICIDIFLFFSLHSFSVSSWHVRNCACRNETILIMQMWALLIGMFCFINYIPLSEVKLYLNNFTEIVTKIWNCVPRMPLLI